MAQPVALGRLPLAQGNRSRLMLRRFTGLNRGDSSILDLNKDLLIHSRPRQADVKIKLYAVHLWNDAARFQGQNRDDRGERRPPVHRSFFGSCLLPPFPLVAVAAAAAFLPAAVSGRRFSSPISSQSAAFPRQQQALSSPSTAPLTTCAPIETSRPLLVGCAVGYGSGHQSDQDWRIGPAVGNQPRPYVPCPQHQSKGAHNGRAAAHEHHHRPHRDLGAKGVVKRHTCRR